MRLTRHWLAMLAILLVFCSFVPSARAGSAVAAGHPELLSHTQVVQGCLHYRVAPRFYIVIACGDGNLYLNGLHWRYWHKYDARGHGYLVANDCDPSCAEGHFHRYPARFHLTRAWSDHHHFVFHHVSTRFTGALPPHHRYLREMQLVSYPI